MSKQVYHYLIFIWGSLIEGLPHSFTLTRKKTVHHNFKGKQKVDKENKKAILRRKAMNIKFHTVFMKVNFVSIISNKIYHCLECWSLQMKALPGSKSPRWQRVLFQISISNWYNFNQSGLTIGTKGSTRKLKILF